MRHILIIPLAFSWLHYRHNNKFFESCESCLPETWLSGDMTVATRRCLRRGHSLRKSYFPLLLAICWVTVSCLVPLADAHDDWPNVGEKDIQAALARFNAQHEW